MRVFEKFSEIASQKPTAAAPAAEHIAIDLVNGKIKDLSPTESNIIKKNQRYSPHIDYADESKQKDEIIYIEKDKTIETSERKEAIKKEKEDTYRETIQISEGVPNLKTSQNLQQELNTESKSAPVQKYSFNPVYDEIDDKHENVVSTASDIKIPYQLNVKASHPTTANIPMTLNTHKVSSAGRKVSK